MSSNISTEMRERQNEWINIRESLADTYIGLVRVRVHELKIFDVVNVLCADNTRTTHTHAMLNILAHT